MSDTRPAFEQLTDTARLALARGDRDGARSSLNLAFYSADSDASIAAETPEGLMRLGGLYHDAGLSAEAERLFADAVAVAERTLGSGHAMVGEALARLGAALIARGAHADAEPLMTRALAIAELHLGVDSPDLNVLLNALSRLYLRRNAFELAAPLLDRLLAMKRIKGEDHPEVATVLASLALVRQGVGDHEGAEQLGRRVLQIRERTLAPNHYGIASALELLADACSARGKIGEAVQLYQRALSIREQTLGVSHASLRVARERIADLQLQAAEETGDDDLSLLQLLPMPPAVTPLPVPVVAPPKRTAAPAHARPVALPVDHAATLPPTLSVAPRPQAERSSAMLAPSAWPAFADEETGEQRQQALVLPAGTGALSLHEELSNIENEMNEAAALEGQRSRAAALAVAAWAAISARRTQVAVITAGVAALVVAVRIAQPRAADDANAGFRSGSSSLQSGNAALGAAGAARSDGGADSGFIRTSGGAVALRPISSPSVARPTSSGGSAESSAPGRGAPNQAEETPPLELGRAIKAPLPNVNVVAGDSIARVADAKVGGDGFSRQFWTSGLDKKGGGAESTSPRNAKLMGDMPQPFYPEFLRKNGIEGEVVVQFVVDVTGRPDLSTLEVVRSPHDALTTSVRKVVERMRFEPALTGGSSPAPRTEVVQISFAFRTGVK